MHPGLKKIAALPGVRAIAPWLGLVALNALFVAPGVALQLPERPWLLLQPSGDLLVLTAVCVLAARWRYGKWVQRAAVLVGVLLWIYLWDELVATAIVQQNPPLYDQLFLLKHLGVLVLDLWNWEIGLALVGASAVLGLVVVLGRLLLRKVTEELARRSWKQTVPVAAVVVLGLAIGTAVDVTQKRKRGHTVIHWTAPALAGNIDASVKMYRALQRGIERSPYANYAQDYALDRTPDVHLFLVESYGHQLIADPEAGPQWEAYIREFESKLEDNGWHAVSAFSTAPVSGGRSWLAEATLLTGVFVRFEAVFQHLQEKIDETPNLVSFLDAQGYETILLAPKDRPRPGVGETINRYDYDRQILALDLEYDGPQYGWGVIPDQYSLGYADEHAFSRVDGPMFTNFHMVSSHAPWQHTPAVYEDWHALQTSELPEGAPEPEVVPPSKEFVARMRRYQRKRPRYNYMGDADALKVEAFAAAIHYDLQLLFGYLEDLDRDAIVIIMGDHQPPLLSGADSSFDVPIHILSRDPALLDVFRDAGFADGLVLTSGRPAYLAHEGMFSLVVRALADCCSEAEPPPYLPNGVRPGGKPGR